MYQREFAQRMAAFPGIKDYSRLSVLVNYYSNCEIIKNISKGVFRPPPRVDSSLVRLVPRDVKKDSGLFEVVKMLFMHKNKKVVNALIDSRQFLKVKDKSELRTLLPKLLGKLGEIKVFYLRIDELQKIKERIKDLV